MSPQADSQVDANGWYGYSYGNSSPYHPPGLPVPPLLPQAPPIPQAPITEEIANASSFADILQLDQFWRGRLAPLPGYQSRPGLLPVKETSQIRIGVPTRFTSHNSNTEASSSSINTIVLLG